MSAINQMLRDLDARSTIQVPPATVVDVLRGGSSSRAPKPRWLLIGLGVSALALALMAAYFALGGLQSEQQIPQTSATSIAPPAAPKMLLSRAAIQHTKPALPKRLDTPKAITGTSPAVPATPAPVHTIEAVLRKSGTVLITRNAAALKPDVVPLAPLNAAETERPKASEVIKQAIEVSPAMAAQQLLEEGNVLRREGKLEAAQRKYREALERNPASISARVQLAEIMNERGEAELAVSFLKTAYSQQAEADLAVVLGRMLANRGQRSEALIWFARGNPALRSADHALTGALLAQEQRYPEAIHAYQTALAAEPHRGGWLLGLGLAYDANAQREAARATYRQALVWGEFKPEVVKFLNERTGIAP